MLNDYEKARIVVQDKNNAMALLSERSGMSIARLNQYRARPDELKKAKWIAVHNLAELYDEKENGKMNQTIKNLVEEKIDRHITTVYYDGKVEIKKDSVDVKNGRIRFWELGDVTSWIDLADIDCTEEEAKQLVKHCITEALFALSDKPVTTNFDVKKGGF